MVCTKRRIFALAASVAVVVPMALSAPPSALAGYLVFSKGPDIWVSRDDGTSAQVIVTAAQVGEVRLRKPAVAPGSDAIAFESWNTDSQRVYDWEAGTALKIGNGWASGSIYGGAGASSNDPDVTADRRVIFQSDAVVVTGGCDLYGCGTSGTSSSGLVSVRLDGTDKRALPARCDSAKSPAANPANPAQFTYLGCWTDLTPNDPWDAAVAALRITDGTTDTAISYDDTTQLDAAWSPDGTQIVTSEAGTEPGIWVYPAAGGSFRLAVTPETGATAFASPRFMGNDRIIFARNGDIWSVPATCDHCAFPSQATQITHLGDINDVAWTSASTFRASAPLSQTPQTATPGRDTTPPAVTSATLSKTAFRAGTRSVTFRFSLSEAGRVTLAVARRLPGRRRGTRCVAPTRRLRTAKRCTRLIKVRSTTRSANAGAGAIALNTAGLAPGTYQVTLTASDAAGNVAAPVTRTFTIRRRVSRRR